MCVHFSLVKAEQEAAEDDQEQRICMHLQAEEKTGEPLCTLSGFLS